jgi:hemerythrin-like metal-binding protein
MQPISWSEDFAVGNEKFDSQHRQLIDLINTTMECLERGGTQKEVVSVFKSLQEYAWHHFGAEETYMTEVRFPDYNEHVQQHRDFIQRIMNLNSRLFSDDTGVLQELSDFLKFWLIDHIVICDFKYAAFAGTRKQRVLMT